LAAYLTPEISKGRPDLARFLDEPLDPDRGFLDRGNAYANSAVPAPYATVPSWLRRSFFQVLTPRQFGALMYIYMVSNKQGVSFALTEQIMADLGIRKRDTIAEALNALIDLGFLLHKRMRVALGRDALRSVYQRPATEFTLLRLLEKKLIDGSLYATDERATRSSPGMSEKAVLTGLTALTSDSRAVHDWNEIEDDPEKSAALKALLTRSLAKKQRAHDAID